VRRQLSGKHIWLVGASTGIGRELAFELNRRGARLTLSARSDDRLLDLKKQLGNDTSVKQLDVTNVAAVKELASKIEDLHGVVYLAAAYNPESGDEQMDSSQINNTVSVNLTGAIHLVNAIRDKLSGKESSFIALYASIAGYRGLPNGQPYSATKAGLINYAESLRTDLKGKVDVKVINSGFVDTRLTQQNRFSMPMLMTPAEAAVKIADGLEKHSFEICFPTRFALAAKFMRILPNWLFFRIANRLK